MNYNYQTINYKPLHEHVFTLRQIGVSLHTDWQTAIYSADKEEQPTYICLVSLVPWLPTVHSGIAMSQQDDSERFGIINSGRTHYEKPGSLSRASVQ
jgi:hypothetical protein